MIDPQDIREAIQALRRERSAIGAGVVDVAVKVLSQRLAELEREPTPDVRRQLATVLFADVSGFTAMSEDLDPEEVRDVMNTVWRRVDGIIVEHGGTIDKHIGDAVMALFGVPRAKEDDAIRAVRCGLAMQEALAELSAAGVKEGRPALGMRVGIHTGQVVFGAVGTTGERTVLGDTVNLASRLETAADVGGVLVSDETWQGLRRSFVGAQREPMMVKGKSAPVLTWEVERESDEEGRFDPGGPSPVRKAPFVGRLTELAVLLEAAKAVFDEGGVRYVTIVGEAGTGKSRLCYELQRRLADSGADYELYVGRMPQQESRAPYEILRHQLFMRYGIQESDTPAEAMGKLMSQARLLQAEGGDAVAAIVGQLIGFDCSDHPAVAELISEPRLFQEQAFQAVRQMIEASTARRPAVMLFDDLQWAADASLDLADWLLEHCQHLPVLAVHAIRPTLYERRPDWATRVVNHLRIELTPLSHKETRRLADSLLSGVRGADDALRDRLVTASGGNPFFLEELIRKLTDDGVIVPEDDGGWRVEPERLAEVRVPATLSAVIAARLDALPRAERRALERAAAQGDAKSQARGHTGLASIERILGRYGESLAHADRAAEIAASAGSPADAAEALVQGGWSRAWLGDLPTALQTGRRALALSEEAGDMVTQVAALRLLGSLALTECDYDKAYAQLSEAVDRAQLSGHRLMEGRAHNDFGEYFRLRGEYAEAQARYALAKDAFVRSGDLDGVLLATSNHAGVRLHLGRPEAEAAEADLQALIKETGEGWYNAAEARRHLAEALIVQGVAGEALEAARQAYRLAVESDAAEDVVPSAGVLLDAHRLAGTGGEPEAELEAAFAGADALAADRNMLADRARLLRSHAEWRRAQGDASAADASASAARALFEELGLDLELARQALSPTP